MKLSPPSAAFCRVTAAAAFTALATSVALADFSVSLTSSEMSPRPIGTAVTLSASVSAPRVQRLLYRFDVRTSTGDWRLLQDYRSKSTAIWAPLEEDAYTVRVLALDQDTDRVHAATLPFTLISPGVIANTAVVRPTSHALVALYSAPACPVGAGLRVRFWPAADGPPGITTPFKPCRAARGVNHYIGGMRDNTQYIMRGELAVDGTIVPGALLSYQSGFPTDLAPDYTAIIPAGKITNVQQAVNLSAYGGVRSDGYFAVATDLAGQTVWTFGQPDTDIERVLLVRPVARGTFLIIAVEIGALREIDLTGKTIRETTSTAINRQLTALGQDQMGSFHHEARRLPNGHTIVLASVERILTDVQGPGPVNVYGEMVIDLDKNFQVTWVWNAFDKLDVTKMAILGETCVTDQPGCPPIFLTEPANDWLHMNSIAYSPSDGHLLLSARHQDAVYKIDFADGTGSGDVIWTLGESGDFSLTDNSGDVWPWFSHQHDAQYQGPMLVVYDNGNTRRDALGDEQNSRGQVLLLDELTLQAQLLHNFDLTDYSGALGSAQRLSNGNFHFLSGFLGDVPQLGFASIEVAPSGQPAWVLAGRQIVYRSFRMRSLYTE